MYEKLKILTDNNTVLRRSVGFLVLLFGIIALVTPFTPGAILLCLLGLELIGLEFVLTKKLKARLTKKTSPNVVGDVTSA